jgi:uncharacterized protein YjbI with pentapeptide repeats
MTDDMPLKEQQEKFMQMPDENIDYSDIPPLGDKFFKNAKLVKPNPQTEQKGMISIMKLKGTIRVFLEGSEDGLQRLADLHQSGELQALFNELKPDNMPKIVVTKVEFTTDAKVKVEFSTDAKVIEKAKLIKAIREGTIDKTTLQQVDLSGADLRRVNLWGVKPSETDLSEANLSGANLSGADLWKADLWKANLSAANLSEADLSGADLSGAILSGAILKRADLSGADLWRANLIEADLSSSNLSGADLSGAGVENAIFINATGITPEQKQDLIRRGAIFAEI